MLTYGTSPAFRDGLYICCQPPLGHSRVNQVTQLRTDGVYCRVSAGTRPVILKVVPATGAAFLGTAMDQLMCASFPTPTNSRSHHRGSQWRAESALSICILTFVDTSKGCLCGLVARN